VLPFETEPYRNWVQEVAARYKNDNRVLLWELMGEPDISGLNQANCPADAAQVAQAWVKDVGGLIKSIDRYHLTSLGQTMWPKCGMGFGSFSDWQAVNSSPYIDTCCYHEYLAATNSTGTSEGGSSNGLEVRQPVVAALNKPLYVGECGIQSTDPSVSGNLTTRAGLMDAKLSYQLANYNICGFVLWDFDLRGPISNTTFWSYAAADPVLAKINNYVTPPAW
jgi:hypothetical protein